MARDHPRGCGENLRQNPNRARHLGSPPRMRGKRRFGQYASRATRITPADAGKTLRITIICSDVKDHPRGCGENNFVPPVMASMKGSPPRMRGKLKQTNGRLSMTRITPADAGKTRGYRPRRRPRQDHPRGCGENLSLIVPRARRAGSPPRMRGKPASICSVMPCLRITPADAGKTGSVFSRHFDAGDHPRGCGENAKKYVFSGITPGSPPRMRGKPRRVDRRSADEIADDRITPADAGKTARASRDRQTERDHPRGCGENHLPPGTAAPFKGSPPRMRGKLSHCCLDSSYVGITPADAGKTARCTPQ